MTRPAGWSRSLSGALAGVLALAALWATSRVTAAVPFPPLALAERVIRLAPGDVATLLIERVQHDAIRLLAAGVTAATLVVAALLPVLVARRDGRERPGRAAAVLATGLALAGLLDPVRPSAAAAIAAPVAASLLHASSSA